MPAATPAGDFVLRALEARDLPALAVLLPALLPGDWSAESINTALGAGHQFSVLVQRDASGAETLAGLAEFQRIVDEGHLLGIAVAPALQGRGLGKRLLAKVLTELRAQQCTRCLLEVRRSNAAAQALYRRAGFTLDGVRPRYYPALAPGQPAEDALLYSCPLL